MEFKIKNEYPIYVTNWIFTKKSILKPILVEKDTKLDNESQEFFLKKLQIFGINVKFINQFRFYKFYVFPYIENYFIDYYDCLSVNKKIVRVIEIADICITPKYRNKKIGSQLLAILEEIARDNKVNFIVGDLQKDDINEPLEERNKFFIKNGFTVEKSSLSKFSGFIVKKQINYEL